MILRVVVNANQLIERVSWRLGYVNGGSASMDLAGLLHEGGYKFGKYHDVRMYEHRLEK